MNNAYPSIRELIPDAIRAKLPSLLEQTVTERYETLGPKYLTENRHYDGRAINSCMLGNSCQEALEEVVDAVFNTLVWIYKQHEADEMTNSSYIVLTGLIEIYTILYVEANGNEGFL